MSLVRYEFSKISSEIMQISFLETTDEINLFLITKLF